MRIFSVVALAAGIILATASASQAQTGMKNGSADAGTTKARCSPGDPNVMLNLKTKMYTLDTPAKSPSKSMSSSSSAMMHSTSQSTMKSVCKSEAMSMGAHMSKSTTSMSKPKGM